MLQEVVQEEEIFNQKLGFICRMKNEGNIEYFFLFLIALKAI